MYNYIFAPNKITGKVLVDKLSELKVPKKMIGKLLADGQLVLEDGRKVFAKDVREEDTDAPSFLIVNITWVGSLVQIVKHATFQKYLDKLNKST